MEVDEHCITIVSHRWVWIDSDADAETPQQCFGGTLWVIT
jgi:hypothetical protein